MRQRQTERDRLREGRETERGDRFGRGGGRQRKKKRKLLS